MLKSLWKFLKHHLWVKRRIPKGDYCYTIKRIEYRTEEPFTILHTDMCPYYNNEEEDGFCDFLGIEDALIWDQCKSCGINDHKDEGV